MDPFDYLPKRDRNHTIEEMNDLPVFVNERLDSTARCPKAAGPLSTTFDRS